VSPAIFGQPFFDAPVVLEERLSVDVTGIQLFLFDLQGDIATEEVLV
jgi:hypothetical protein